jgi:hypothetical protein
LNSAHSISDGEDGDKQHGGRDADASEAATTTQVRSSFVDKRNLQQRFSFSAR